MRDTLDVDESEKVLFSIGPGFSSIPDIIDIKLDSFNVPLRKEVLKVHMEGLPFISKKLSMNGKSILKSTA
jgi:hypothetical protein